ncbi:hypothetical protein [Sulfobacillus harzensis]|uniref:CopG family transcriptional regulator n=1 Tax=Sulfobacillus harzensis TaxID=2729629 RepID=A0A7Y0L1T8_9FIRM|nr:hypothetical protein [Sulfobacillus harzensis]NMP21726.1 hypothetical protein [Sulfobacillus harzensis]
MAEAKATTIRFSEAVYKGLESVSALTGLPVNSIVVEACIEYLRDNYPDFWLGPTSQRQLMHALRDQVREAMRQRNLDGSRHPSQDNRESE